MLIESWTITCMRWLAAIRRRTIRMTGNQTKLNQFIQILCKFVWHCCHCQWTDGAGCTPPRFSASRYFPILAQTSHFPHSCFVSHNPHTYFIFQRIMPTYGGVICAFHIKERKYGYTNSISRMFHRSGKMNECIQCTLCIRKLWQIS